jgi:hypothetical protein
MTSAECAGLSGCGNLAGVLVANHSALEDGKEDVVRARQIWRRCPSQLKSCLWPCFCHCHMRRVDVSFAA